jgi:predicted CXXCH cytochrome family protein
MSVSVRSVLQYAAFGLFLAACTTTDIVYVDREPFNPPPDAISGLLGYYQASSKQTTCGNCHVGHQRDWATTHHADAYATLDDRNIDPVARKFCYSCHDVSATGNDLTGEAGWDVAADPAYQDVQCESCHGPGNAHVQAPENQAAIPMAKMGADVDESCAACHTGSHHGFADEWRQSGHGQVLAYPAGREGCNACHEARGAIFAWGERSNYAEINQTELLPTATCATCHDPHGSDNEHQLRWAVDSRDPATNLCMKCHYRVGVLEIDATRGAHGPQGFIVLGEGMYRPGGITIDTLISLTTHASDRNPRLCAGCHVNRYTINDAETGDFVFNSTGHLFAAIPCIDGQGVPQANQDCAYTPTVRSFKSCVSAGCHETEAIAAGRFNGARLDLKLLADQIWDDKDGDENLDAAPTDGGLLAIIKRDNPSALSDPNSVTPAEGALFNVRTFGEDRYGHPDGSKGTHNAFLARALLSANIVELQNTYGLGPVVRAEVQALVEKSLQQANDRQPGFFIQTAQH